MIVNVVIVKRSLKKANVDFFFTFPSKSINSQQTRLIIRDLDFLNYVYLIYKCPLEWYTDGGIGGGKRLKEGSQALTWAHITSLTKQIMTRKSWIY